MAFNIFRKKETDRPPGIFTDKTYISTSAKMNACLELSKKDPGTIFICWFPDTARQLSNFFKKNGIAEPDVTEARFVQAPQLQYKTAVFAEHHPMHTKEMELIKNWTQEKILVFSAMDEPLFTYFGSEKMIPFMKMLGMKEEEAIEHVLVSRSIIRGQEKIAKQVGLDQSAHSQAEWMEKNLK